MFILVYVKFVFQINILSAVTLFMVVFQY